MWLCLNDAFISIVFKDCKPGELLVRARRRGDIEKVFGRHVTVTEYDKSDYLFRAVVPRSDVISKLQNEVLRIDYGNFKDSVVDHDLHDAYMSVWSAMARTQETPPYSGLPFLSGRRYHVMPKPKQGKQKKQGKQQQKGGSKNGSSDVKA